MKSYLEKRVVAGFLSTVLVLLLLGFLVYSSAQRLIDAYALLIHNHALKSTADRTLKSVVDMETADRGFIITGKEEYLQPYINSSREVNEHLSVLDSLIGQDRTQRTLLDTLQTLIREHAEWTRKSIAVRSKNFEEARTMLLDGDGKRIVDNIRGAVQRLETEEDRQFASRNTITTKSLSDLEISFIGLVAGCLLVVIVLFYFIRKMLRHRKEAERKAIKAAEDAEDLYNNAPCGYFTTAPDRTITRVNNTLADWLGYTPAQIAGKMKFEELLPLSGRESYLQGYSDRLTAFVSKGKISDRELDFVRKDGSVFNVIVNSTAVYSPTGEYLSGRSTVIDATERKKTAENLMSLNQELEAFTYSVSHDLRTPLRAISGYARMLEEDHAEHIGEDGTRLTGNIVTNAVRMGRLIDDLLEFSRLGRKSVTRKPIDMQSLVNDVLNELVTPEMRSRIKLDVGPIENTTGDINMLRQVWINLIANAIKYSSKKEHPEITIRSERKSSGTEYSVRDNGAGFDMMYASKLFGVFQRLHKTREFEGTGVGLALVKTILQKHEGEIHADARINEGAVFTFTLPITPVSNEQ